MAYDTDRGVMVLFGGETWDGFATGYLNDLWEYDGASWRKIEVSGTIPDPRSNHAMAYDPVRKEIIMFGGQAGGDSAKSDLWVYTHFGDNGSWRQLPTPGSPLARAGHSMVWDPDRQMVLMFGGEEDPYNRSPNPRTRAQPDGITRGWDGTQWQDVSTSSPLRYGQAMAYDSARHVLVVAGGYLSSGYINATDDVLEMDLANTWHDLGAGLIPVAGNYNMGFDEKYKRLTLVGPNGAYAYLPSGPWQRIDAAGAADNAPLVYDPGRQKLVMMGGSFLTRADTWELSGVSMPLAIALPVEPPCVETTATLTALGDTRPLLTQWFRQAPDGSFTAIPGFVDGHLTITNASDADAINYKVRAYDSCGNQFESDPYKLAVYHPPSVHLLSPASSQVCPGETISLAVQVQSESPFTCQWYKGGSNGNPPVPVVGATNLVLTLTNLNHSDTGLYFAGIANRCGQVGSSATTLQVGVTILAQPQDATGKVCKAVTFAVGATGVGSLSYHWRLDGAFVEDDGYFHGARSSQLDVHPLLYAHEGNYDVVVTDSCGPQNAVTSQVARVTVTPGPEWVLRTTNSPPARTAARMVYDSKRHVTVLFGGVGINPGNTNLPMTLNDLWEWNGSRWTQRMTNALVTKGWLQDKDGNWHLTYADNQPVHRRDHSMVYDSWRGKTVMFGGYTWEPGYGGFSLWQETDFNDLWEWDGVHWTFASTNGPSARDWPAMAFDTRRGVSMIYGGNGPVDQLWEWDGANWRSTNTFEGAASPRYFGGGISMVYDTFRGSAFVGPFGVGLNVTPRGFWAWDGSAWISRGEGFADSAPAPYNDGMVYDTYRRKVIYFGGNFFGYWHDTWSWDSGGWKKLDVPAGSPSPSDRDQPAMAYDSDRHVAVLFGGMNSRGNPNDPAGVLPAETWELIAVDKPLVNEQPLSQFVQVGATATLRASAISPDGSTLTSVLYKDGQEVPAGRAPLTREGNSFSYALNDVTSHDAGVYVIRFIDECGSTDTLPAVLSLDSKLQILAASPALLVWNGPNLVLEQSPTSLGPWTPVPGAASPFNLSLSGAASFYRLR